jgi:cytochrome d ubiquinol oxidase subunit I
MVGCAAVMLGLVLLGGWLRWRGRLFDTPLFLRLLQLATPLGFVAVIAGWCVTEVGRQPWTVYGLLRTAESVSPSLTSFDVALSLAGYMLVYLLIYPWGLFLMLRIVRKGPEHSGEQALRIEAGRPEAPVLARALTLATGETR